MSLSSLARISFFICLMLFPITNPPLVVNYINIPNMRLGVNTTFRLNGLITDLSRGGKRFFSRTRLYALYMSRAYRCMGRPVEWLCVAPSASGGGLSACQIAPSYGRAACNVPCDLLGEIPAKWEIADNAKRAELIRSTVRAIVVHDGRVDISWREPMKFLMEPELLKCFRFQHDTPYAQGGTILEPIDDVVKRYGLWAA